MATAVFLAPGHRITVGEHFRIGGFVPVQGHGVAGHHIGPVLEPGDAAEALGFALGEIAVLAAVKAGKLGVLVRLDAHPGFQGELVR